MGRHRRKGLPKYITVGEYQYEEIAPLLLPYCKAQVLHMRKVQKDPSVGVAMLDGYPVKLFSDRYVTFATSQKCSACGKVGTVFRLEKHRKEKTDFYHFNLYHVTKDGKYILMTKDHIKPKSKGGKNHTDNYQTMCYRCNGKKGDKYECNNTNG